MMTQNLRFAAALSLLFTGCVHFPARVVPVETNPSKSGPLEVKLEGKGKVFEAPEKATLPLSEYTGHAAQLLAAGRTSAARRWIAAYPDLALEVLCSTTCRQAGLPVVQEIARVRDQQDGAGPNEGWQAVLRDRGSQPQRYQAHEKARQQLQQHLAAKDYEAAAGIDLLGTLPANAAPLQIDACRLTATALLHAGLIDQAAHALERVLPRIEKHTYEDAFILLLASDAQRRLEQHERAGELWREAVLRAGRLLSATPALIDPNLWERCSYQRPYSDAWPAEAQQQIHAYLQARKQPAAGPLGSAGREHFDRGECLVWLCIGCTRLQRNEAQAALLALKRAETATSDLRTCDFLHLAQAEAFSNMNQPVAAMALLVQLAGQTDPQVASPALAYMGALKLKEGCAQQAAGFLRKALESKADWPGRGDAEANLGLAYLSLGQEQPGLHWLRSAQRRFQEASDLPALRQSLGNEARYWEHSGKMDHAENARRRMDRIER